MTWLGPSVIFTSVPLGFGYAVHALVNARDRVFAIGSLALAGAELLLLLILILVSVANMMVY